MARASRKTVRIWSAAVPFLPGALDLVAGGIASAGLKANRDGMSADVTFAEGVPEPVREALFDPQTSGGLLVAVPASRLEAFVSKLRRRKMVAAVIGEVLPRGRRPLEVAA